MCLLGRWDKITIYSRNQSQQEILMNAETLKPAVEDLIAKVVGGKALEAFAPLPPRTFGALGTLSPKGRGETN